MPRDAEVGEYPASVVAEDVLWLDVSVDDACSGQLSKPGGDVLQYWHELVGSKSIRMPVYSVAQVGFGAGHHDHQVALMCAGVELRHDVARAFKVVELEFSLRSRAADDKLRGGWRPVRPGGLVDGTRASFVDQRADQPRSVAQGNPFAFHASDGNPLPRPGDRIDSCLVV